jgi:hypothetical protein
MISVTRVRRIVAATASAVLLGAGVVVGIAAPAQAANPANFDPGYIISDQRFFDANAMDEGGIQSFLRSKLPNCAQSNGMPCLPNFTESTTSRAATTRCTAYTGEANEPASRIINKVAKACGINPQVLIVTLQKENGLVTNGSPRAGSYRTAMGYACPDTAACDSQYFGFFNQVYSAASQFIRYGVNPASWRYRVGAVAVQFHPNAACGSTVVNIRNRATAALYNYTPYQPNAAAMANMYATGDACSSYGNRNFWAYFTDWFGSTTGPINPFGWLDAAVPAPGGVRISGWALDPDTTDSITLHAYVDGKMASAVATTNVRADVGAAYPASGAAHGFDEVVPISGGGSHSLCIYGLNVGPGQVSIISCLNVTAGGGPAVGWFDNAVAGEATVTVDGWAIDPDTASPTDVHVYVDNTRTITSASVARSDIARAYPAYGSGHGFSVTVPAAAGAHSVCAYAIDAVSSPTHLGCRQVVVKAPIAEKGRAPIGYLDSASTSVSGISVSGWTIDEDTKSSIAVHVYVDKSFAVSTPASVVRSDVASAYPQYGGAHGYATTVAATPGVHEVCAFAINSVAGTNPSLGCRTVTVPAPTTMTESGRTPIGWVDSIGATSSGYSLSGWTIDQDTTAPIDVHVYVDSAHVGTATANVSRPDVGASYQAYGNPHGYQLTVPASAGSHLVCVYAINSVAGVNPQLGCARVTR